MNDEAENVVVFSNKYFSRQYKILSKKEYEPNTLTLFAFPNESKEKATAKIKKYAKIHGPNDFELTDTPQSTLYITDEFLKTVKKETFSKLQIKYSLSLHYLSVQFLFQQLRRLQIYNTIGKKKNFYNVWEFMKKSGKKFLM